MLGQVIQVDWNVTIQQIPVLITGAWRNENKPGVEDRVGTFVFQDVDDSFTLQVYNFVVARRTGDRSAAAFPEFSLVTLLDDIGAPAVTRWQLDGCQLFSYSGGFNQADDLITRQIPFTFRTERPLDSFVYGDSGVQITSG
jgi:hypothetical protein